MTRDHILVFLLQFRELDYSDVECQKRLIEVFVNSIFVNDDEITFIFNFSDENNTVTLSDLNAAKGGKVFARCASCSTRTRTAELLIFDNVFALATKTR